MMLKGSKRMWGLTFELVSLFYLLIISILRFSLHSSLLSAYLILPVIFSVHILVFWIERGYFISYKLLFRGHVSMNLLIAIACHATYLYSLIMLIIKTTKIGVVGIEHEFWETPVALFTLFRIGKLIENRLKNTSMKSKYEIMQLKNQKSLVIVENEHRLVDINRIKVGDLLYIPKGAMVTLDAKLVSKDASLDLSSITGEKDSTSFKEGDEIFSGSINLGEAFICRAIRGAEESKLGQILQHLEDMMGRPSKIDLVSQKIIKYFVPVTLLIVLITFITWLSLSYTVGVKDLYYLYKGDRDASPIGVAIWVATSVLVIACPCSFGIAAPIATYSSSIIATDNRILFSNGEIFERLLKLRYAVFDKTGTITENTSQVSRYLGDEAELVNALKLSKTSTHPISKAITLWIQEKGIKDEEILTTKEITGVGIEADINSSNYQLVSKKYSDNMGYTYDLEFKEDNDLSTTMLVREGRVVGIFLVEDVIRENSKSTIRALKRLGIKCLILSGDSCKNVKRVANLIGMDEYQCQLTPEMKMDQVKRLGEIGDVVYVGDGINDVLATKAAKLSISFESGADLNKSLSDITIIDNDIFSVYRAIMLSRKTVNTIRVNFLWAIIFNLVALPLAFLGFIIPWLGMLMMMISSIVLILHTLLRHRLNSRYLQQSLNYFKIQRA